MNGNSSKPYSSGSPRGIERYERWYWLDWLRVLAMGTIFLYHSGRPFVLVFPWHIMNPEPDLVFTLVNVFVTGWIMPLFFVISGFATYFSLTKRSPMQFAKDRFKRLMIPFIFVGLLLVLPVHVYYDAVFHGRFAGSFIDFYIGPYFTKAFPFNLDFSPTYFADSNQGVYLWYVFWLFIFSLITVHLFKWLTQEANRGRISRLASLSNRRGGIFLLAIPIIVVNILAVPPFFVFPSGYGGWKLPAYLALFITAYVLASDSQFLQSIDRSRIPALLLGTTTSVATVLLFVTLAPELLATPLWYVTVSTVWALNGWCWVVAILGFGRRLLSFNHKFLGISNELVLPFYVLHQTVIVMVAFYVVHLNLIVIEKYLIIVLISFAVISALLLPISQINLLRFLFGMRPKKRQR
jgi:hypothetical protein